MASAFFLALLLAIRLLLPWGLRKLKALTEKTANDFDDIVYSIIKRIPKLFFVSFSLLITLKLFIHLDNDLENFVDAVLLILVIFEVVRIAQSLIFYFLRNSALGKDRTSLQGVKLVIRIILWVIAFLLIISNLGFNITTLAASLGIGGIAIALAIQNILQDLFASFTIYFDKPFQVGDFIVIGTDSGVVEKIGLKSTRIHTLQGEELVVSNRELTESRVRNFKQLLRRRVMFKFGVTYETEPKKLKNIPDMIQKIIKTNELLDFDRCHFREFNDSSLDFEVVYFVNSAKFKDSVDAQHEINIALLEAFAKAKINMAYPTRTVYMKDSV